MARTEATRPAFSLQQQALSPWLLTLSQTSLLQIRVLSRAFAAGIRLRGELGGRP